jgi:DNA modification methylase
MEIINKPIVPHKSNTWHFKSHQYFTKQASNVVAEYIEKFSNPGETILDPYCGTGVTAIEAIRLKRKVIVFDINPLATFITKQMVAQVNTDNLSQIFTEMKDSLSPTIEKYNSMTDNQLKKVEIPFWYPKKIKLPKNSDFEYVEELYSKRQLIIYTILFDYIKKIKDEDIREMMKFVFSATMSKVNLTYWDNPNRGSEGGGAAIFGAYRYHKPQNMMELDVWKNFLKRFSYIIKGKKTWNQLTHGLKVNDYFQVYTKSALSLSSVLKENSIDYIYTDPPYGSNIAYLDLSTMWNAWLGFKVSPQDKKEEVIEGGDLCKTQIEYEKLLTKSINEMSKVLKKDKWLSLVFAHKKLEFWNVIIDSCELNGIEFKGSTFQPTNNSSIHYKKNPANVLCSQRIANFQKTYQVSYKEKTDDIREYILNEIERACLENNGAGIDKIYNRVLDKLHNNNMIHEAKRKGYLKLNSILDDKSLFYYNPDNKLYYVKDQNSTENVYVKDYFTNKNEFKIYLRSLLSKHEMTLDEIHKSLFEIFESDIKFPIEKDLEEVLSEIAFKSKKTHKWTLAGGEQQEMSFENILSTKLIKINGESHSHSEVIYRLYVIGKCLGFASWIGKKEQSVDTYNGLSFAELSLNPLPIKNMKPHLKEKIQQIDVIWFDKLGNPRYAFEVEESTSINSGLERFAALLDTDISIANNLFIIAPKSRKSKIDKIFRKDSIFCGHPYYLENKVLFMLKEDLEKYYNENALDEKGLIENEFKRIGQKMEVN